jgi:hypothetical protein
MGTDIHGYVEAYDRGLGWRAVFDIGPLAFRDYETFGLLFGVRRTNYQPIAAHRGLPADASREARQSYHYFAQFPDVHSASWILWKEIAAIDWEAQARHLEEQGSRHAEWASLQWQYFFKRLKDFIKAEEKRPRKRGITAIDWQGLTFALERDVAEHQRQGKLHDVPQPAWQMIFYLMKQLAIKYGPQHMRLVVWFDG